MSDLLKESQPPLFQGWKRHCSGRNCSMWGLASKDSALIRIWYGPLTDGKKKKKKLRPENMEPAGNKRQRARWDDCSTFLVEVRQIPGKVMEIFLLRLGGSLLIFYKLLISPWRCELASTSLFENVDGNKERKVSVQDSPSYCLPLRLLV